MTRYIPVLFVSILALLLLAPFTVQAQTPEAGSTITIEGQISNATPGGSVPPNLPLMLHLYDGMHMADMLHGTADEQGRFRFENVANASGRTFAVMVNHADVSYASQRVELMAGETHLYLPVSIHDTTTEARTIQIEQQQLLLKFKPEALRVAQLYILSNLGDRAVVDGGEHNLRFRLPAGATDVSFEQDEEGTRFVHLEGGFADTAPVAPGRSTRAIVVNYTLPLSEKDPIELQIPADYPTAQTAVLLPDAGVTLDGLEWTAEEELLIRDSVHQVYSYAGGTLNPGESLRLVLVGQPEISEANSPESGPVTSAAAAVPARDSRRPIFLLGVALSVMLIGSGAVLGWRDHRRATMPEPVSASAAPTSESEELQSVLAAIAELDRAYAAGTISEAEYQERRAGLRDQAVTVMLMRRPTPVEGTARKQGSFDQN